MEECLDQVMLVLHNMQKTLECVICMDMMTDPLTTKCGHSFCTACIHEVIRGTRGAVPCPLCQAPLTRRSLNKHEKIVALSLSVRGIITAIEKDCGYEVSPSKRRPRPKPYNDPADNDSEDEENDEPRRRTRQRGTAVASNSHQEIFTPVTPLAKSKGKIKKLPAAISVKIVKVQAGKKLPPVLPLLLKGEEEKTPVDAINNEHSYSSPKKFGKDIIDFAGSIDNSTSHQAETVVIFNGREELVGSVSGISGHVQKENVCLPMGMSNMTGRRKVETMAPSELSSINSNEELVTVSQQRVNRVTGAYQSEQFASENEPSHHIKHLGKLPSQEKVKSWLDRSREMGYQVGVSQSTCSAYDSDSPVLLKSIQPALEMNWQNIEKKSDSGSVESSVNESVVLKKFFKTKDSLCMSAVARADSTIGPTLADTSSLKDVSTINNDPYSFIPSQKTPVKNSRRGTSWRGVSISSRDEKGYAKRRTQDAIAIPSKMVASRVRGRGPRCSFLTSRTTIGFSNTNKLIGINCESTPLQNRRNNGLRTKNDIDISIIRPTYDTVDGFSPPRESLIIRNHEDDDHIPDSFPTIETADHFDKIMSENHKKTKEQKVPAEIVTSENEEVLGLFLTPIETNGQIEKVSPIDIPVARAVKKTRLLMTSRPSVTCIKETQNSSCSDMSGELPSKKRKKRQNEVNEMEAILSSFAEVDSHELSFTRNNILKENEDARSRDEISRRQLPVLDHTMENTRKNCLHLSKDLVSHDVMPPPCNSIRNKRVKFNRPVSTASIDIVKVPLRPGQGEVLERVNPRSNVRYAHQVKQRGTAGTTPVSLKTAKSPGWSHVAGAKRDLKSRHIALNITGGELREGGKLESVQSSMVQLQSSSESGFSIDDSKTQFDVDYLPTSQSKVDRARKLKKIVSDYQRVALNGQENLEGVKRLESSILVPEEQLIVLPLNDKKLLDVAIDGNITDVEAEREHIDEADFKKVGMNTESQDVIPSSLLSPEKLQSVWLKPTVLQAENVGKNSKKVPNCLGRICAKKKVVSKHVVSKKSSRMTFSLEADTQDLLDFHDAYQLTKPVDNISRDAGDSSKLTENLMEIKMDLDSPVPYKENLGSSINVINSQPNITEVSHAAVTSNESIGSGVPDGNIPCVHNIPCELFQVLVKYAQLLLTQQHQHRDCSSCNVLTKNKVLCGSLNYVDASTMTEETICIPKSVSESGRLSMPQIHSDSCHGVERSSLINNKPSVSTQTDISLTLKLESNMEDILSKNDTRMEINHHLKGFGSINELLFVNSNDKKSGMSVALESLSESSVNSHEKVSTKSCSGSNLLYEAKSDLQSPFKALDATKPLGQDTDVVINSLDDPISDNHSTLGRKQQPHVVLSASVETAKRSQRLLNKSSKAGRSDEGAVVLQVKPEFKKTFGQGKLKSATANDHYNSTSTNIGKVKSSFSGKTVDLSGNDGKVADDSIILNGEKVDSSASKLQVMLVTNTSRVPVACYSCNLCDSKIYSGWHCLDCPEFNLCEKCHNTNSHQHQLVFLESDKLSEPSKEKKVDDFPKRKDSPIEANAVLVPVVNKVLAKNEDAYQFAKSRVPVPMSSEHFANVKNLLGNDLDMSSETGSQFSGFTNCVTTMSELKSTKNNDGSPVPTFDLENGPSALLADKCSLQALQAGTISVEGCKENRAHSEGGDDGAEEMELQHPWSQSQNKIVPTCGSEVFPETDCSQRSVEDAIPLPMLGGSMHTRSQRRKKMNNKTESQQLSFCSSVQSDQMYPKTQKMVEDVEMCQLLRQKKAVAQTNSECINLAVLSNRPNANNKNNKETSGKDTTTSSDSSQQSMSLLAPTNCDWLENTVKEPQSKDFCFSLLGSQPDQDALPAKAMTANVVSLSTGSGRQSIRDVNAVKLISQTEISSPPGSKCQSEVLTPTRRKLRIVRAEKSVAHVSRVMEYKKDSVVCGFSKDKRIQQSAVEMANSSDSEGTRSMVRSHTSKKGNDGKKRFRRIRNVENSNSSSDDDYVARQPLKRKPLTGVGVTGHNLATNSIGTCHSNSQEIRDMERLDQNIWNYFGPLEDDNNDATLVMPNSVDSVQNSDMKQVSILKSLEQNEDMTLDEDDEFPDLFVTGDMRKNEFRNQELQSADEEFRPSTADVYCNVEADLQLIHQMRQRRKAEEDDIMIISSEDENEYAKEILKRPRNVIKVEKKDDDTECLAEPLQIYSVNPTAGDLEIENVSHSSTYSTQSEGITTQKCQHVQEEIEALMAKVRELEALEDGKASTNLNDAKSSSSYQEGRQHTQHKDGNLKYSHCDESPIEHKLNGQLISGKLSNLQTGNEFKSESKFAEKLKEYDDTCPIDDCLSQESDSDMFACLPKSRQKKDCQRDEPSDRTSTVHVSTLASLLQSSRPPHCIICSGLLVSEVQEVKTFIDELSLAGSSLCNVWNDAITHVVVKADEDSTAQRTLKYLLGVAKGCWVVDLKWVRQSTACESILPESHYEVVDCTKVPGPLLSRISTVPLFIRCRFYVHPPLADLSIDNIKMLISYCGGEVVDSLAELHLEDSFLNLILVQVDNCIEGNDLQRRHNLVAVGHDWVIECIGLHTIISLFPYLLEYPTPTQISKSHIPQYLLQETQEI